MIYLKIRWVHDNSKEPSEILVELDEDRYELRKIEKFKGGAIGFTSEGVNVNCAQLSDLPVPSLEDINGDTQFKAEHISAGEFEVEWIRASSSASR